MSKKIHFYDDDSLDAGIDMSPLIDMVFILLIFFIITTNFNKQTGVDVSKPSAKTAVSLGQKTMLIGITREGTLHVYGRQITIKRLENIVKQEVKKRPNVSVVIVADKHAQIGKAVKVMDICTLAGVKKVSVGAEKSRL